MDTLNKKMESNIYTLLQKMKTKSFWSESKIQIETINVGGPIKYNEDFTEIRFESDDDLSLGKPLNILEMIIVTTSVFEKDGKYYPQVYLHECLYKL